MTRFRVGVITLFVSVLIAFLFFIPAYVAFYAKYPAMFLTLTIIGVVFAFLGSYLIRDSFFGGVRREQFLFALLNFLGELMVLAGVFVGLLALYGAFSLGVVSGYWGWQWGKSYYFGYHVSSITLFHISMLRLSIIALIAGQFFIGFGHKG